MGVIETVLIPIREILSGFCRIAGRFSGANVKYQLIIYKYQSTYGKII